MTQNADSGFGVPVETPEDQGEALTARWGLGTAAGLTVLTALVTLGGGLLAAAASELPAIAHAPADVGAAVKGTILLLAYLSVVVAVRQASRAVGLSLAEAVGLRPVPLGRTLLAAGGLALGGRVLAGLWVALVMSAGFEVPQDLDPTRILPLTPIGISFTVLLACVAAPIAEEMVFRGVLLPALQARWGVTTAVTVSAAVFAVLHVVGIVIPAIFLFALLLGRSFLRSRSLWTPIAAHAVFNGLGLASLYLLRGAAAL